MLGIYTTWNTSLTTQQQVGVVAQPKGDGQGIPPLGLTLPLSLCAELPSLSQENIGVHTVVDDALKDSDDSRYRQLEAFSFPPKTQGLCHAHISHPLLQFGKRLSGTGLMFGRDESD